MIAAASRSSRLRQPNPTKARPSRRQGGRPGRSPLQTAAPAKADDKAGFARALHRAVAHRQRRFRISLADRHSRQHSQHTAASSISAKAPNCSASISPSPIPRSDCSTASTPAPTAGAAILTTRLTSGASSAASTTSPSTTGTSPTSTPCRRSPIRCSPAASTSSPSIPTGAPACSIWTSSPASGSCPTWPSTGTPATATESRPGCRTPMNEFAVPVLLRDSTNNYRGGVRFEYQSVPRHPGAGRHHVQGRRPDQLQRRQPRRPDHAASGQHIGAEQPDAGLRHSRQQHLQQGPADRQSNVLDERLRPVPLQPAKTDVDYSELAGGNFRPAQRAAVSTAGNTDLATGVGHPAAHVWPMPGVELRPFRRLRIIESFTTDR